MADLSDTMFASLLLEIEVAMTRGCQTEGNIKSATKGRPLYKEPQAPRLHDELIPTGLNGPGKMLPYLRSIACEPSGGRTCAHFARMDRAFGKDRLAMNRCS